MPQLCSNELFPGIVAEQVTLRTGEVITVYKCRYPSEGPVRIQSPHGPLFLGYMYAHFVFHWPENTSQVSISHGNLRRSMPLWHQQTIEGTWGEQALMRHGQRWVRDHLAKFRPRGADHA